MKKEMKKKNFILIIKYKLKIGYLKNQTRYSKHKMKGWTNEWDETHSNKTHWIELIEQQGHWRQLFEFIDKSIKTLDGS